MSDLNVTIGADISAYQQGMQQASAIAKGTTDNLNTIVTGVNSQQKSIEQLTIKLAAYQQIVYKATDPAVITEYNGKIGQLNAEIGQLESLGKNAFGNLGSGAMSASMKFQTMRSGISAARDGVTAFAIGGQAGDRMLMAMGHHINSLVNETGSFSGAMKAMGQSLIGPGGIILALTVAYELFQHFSKAESDAYDAAKNFTSAADAQHAVMQNLDDSYQEAVKNVYELTENVKLAKDGFISKSEVVKEYNDTLGKTMGSVKTLNEVEQKLVSGGADYIKMMLYKAAAQTALSEASDKAVESAKAQMKSDDASLSAWDKTLAVLGRVGSGGTGGQGAMGAGAQSDKERAAQAQANRDKEKAAFEKDKNDLLKIADDFQTQAATIASKNKWNFLPDEEVKVKKAKDGFAAIEEEISKLKVKLEDAVISGQKPTILADLSGQITALETKLDALKEKYLLVFYPHMNDTLQTGNTTTQDSINAIQRPLNTHPELDQKTTDYSNTGEIQTTTGIDAAIQAHKREKDAIYSSIITKKQYDTENKLENQTLKELTNTIGRGLTQAFESALNGTQSFVSAMGQFLLQLIEKLIAAAAAAFVLSLVLASFSGGSTILANAGGMAGIFGSLSGLSGLVTGQASGGGGSPGHYAEGGIFNKATVGMFGEAGKEAIVTPQHLADFAGIQQQQQQPMQLSMKLQGSDMLLFLNRANKTKSRTS